MNGWNEHRWKCRRLWGRHSGAGSTSFWLQHMYLKGVTAKRVKLGFGLFFTGSGEAMSVRVSEPLTSKSRAPHLERL